MTDVIADDVLRGADAIGAFLGIEKRTVYHAASNNNFPNFRIGSIVCARKSTLRKWIEDQEGKVK